MILQSRTTRWNMAGTVAGLAFCALSIIAIGCGGDHHGHTVMDTIAAHQRTAAEESHSANHDEIGTPPILAKVVPLQLKNGLPSPTAMVEARSSELHVTNCRQCHVQPVNASDQPRAHWDLNLTHATEVLDCGTCHNADDQMGSLRTLKGQAVEFDHAYRVCSQCHFQQGEDWLGGAHGKRLYGWSGTRVLRNCTGCHDPHQPGFPTRLPSFAPKPVDDALPRSH